MGKPVTKSIRAEKRAAAEKRQAAYDALSHEEKLKKMGRKEILKYDRKGNAT